MTKVHPNAGEGGTRKAEIPAHRGAAEALTVWRKSLLFNGKGFTVFDAKGNLAFRVDNYSAGSRPEIVLMDAVGKPLLTIRRKKLSLGDQWLIYDGEEAVHPRFSVKKDVSLLTSRKLAHVAPCAAGPKSCCGYDIEGSYSQRCCDVYDNRRRRMAEIKRKEAVGGVALGFDVSRLIVEPGLDMPFAMAMVIILEQMFGCRGSLLKG